jgi:small subunit ribosomal protein S9
MSSKTIYYATGKRKTAIARVYVQPGKGEILINRRDMETYFGRKSLAQIVRQAFDLTGTLGQYDVTVNVQGGGLAGQAEAVRHGISKVLEGVNEEFRPTLKKAGLLTRDARKKERKKYGLAGARRAYQFSKR